MAELIMRLEDTELDCPEVVGLASHFRPYRLAWAIGRHPDLSCYKLDDISSYTDHGQHTVYAIKALDMDADYLLVRNRGTLGYFYKKYRDFDFLLFSIAPALSIANEHLAAIGATEGVGMYSKLPTPPAPEHMNFIQCL